MYECVMFFTCALPRSNACSMYGCMYACMHAFVCVCMNACMHCACIHTHTRSLYLNLSGHEGWELQQFLDLPSSRQAGLQREHVIALRLYTSDSFRLFNNGMREKTRPHPIRITIYVLNEALKKLRKVVAKEKPHEYNKVKVLWRGMKDMTLDFEEFKRTGGTEVPVCVCVCVCVRARAPASSCVDTWPTKEMSGCGEQGASSSTSDLCSLLQVSARTGGVIRGLFRV
jgi:hypothetical protein